MNSPTDKPPSASLSCMSFSACKEYSLLCESCYLSKTSFVSTKCLALQFEEELWKLKVPSSLPQAFSLTQPKGMESSLFENIFDVIVDNME